jgi:lipoprotein-releasing system ATP-binding protein
MIKVEGITKQFGSLQVLKGIDLTISKSEIVAITGESGAGKTTLLQIMGTLDRPNSGKVIIHEKDVVKLSDKQLAKFRNQHIGFVFQFHHLLPEFTAIENVCMPAMIGGSSFSKTKGKAKEILAKLNMGHRESHKPGELSGGEQQRVAVARALINNPLVVFADEPTGNLDSQNALELHNLFFQLRDDFGITFVLVTHNHELADRSDRKIMMKDGLISE